MNPAPQNYAMLPLEPIGGLNMEGSIHHDKWGYKIHFKGKWHRGCHFEGRWIPFRDNKKLAEDFLVILNAEVLNKQYDPRDYRKDKPLAFNSLGQNWLEKRKPHVRCYRNLHRHIDLASNFFGDLNYKLLNYAWLQEFFDQLPKSISVKTKRNIKATLTTFCRWVVDAYSTQDIKLEVPKFPPLGKYKKKLRKIVTPQDQAMILDKMKEITPAPKGYLAALWMVTYGLRWIELRPVKRKDFENGVMTVWDWKQDGYKQKKLLPEDWAIVEQDKSFPEQYFFRHPDGSQLGRDYPYSWLKKASVLLGFDVHPYAIVRHSTITKMVKLYGPENVQKHFSLHLAGLYDYWQTDEDKKQEMYAKARPGGVVEMEKKNEKAT